MLAVDWLTLTISDTLCCNLYVLEELFVPVALTELFPSRVTALILKLKQEHDRSLPQEEIGYPEPVIS